MVAIYDPIKNLRNYIHYQYSKLTLDNWEQRPNPKFHEPLPTNVKEALKTIARYESIKDEDSIRVSPLVGD